MVLDETQYIAWAVRKNIPPRELRRSLRKDFLVGKMLCEICDCVVVADGHLDRCRVVRIEDTSTMDAWIGDAVLSLYVRLMLARRGIPSTAVSSYLCSGEYQAQALKEYNSEESGSERTLSTRAEALFSTSRPFRAFFLAKLESENLEHVKSIIIARNPLQGIPELSKPVSSDALERYKELISSLL